MAGANTATQVALASNPITAVPAYFAGAFNSSTGNRHINDARVSQDRSNLSNISDPTQRAAEENFLNQYTGANGFNRGRGYVDLPSVRKGRVSYDTIKEQSLQNYYRDAIKKNQVDAYNAFDPDKYIKNNSDIYRRNLADQVVGARKQVQGADNSRGMLFSGHRQMAEGQIGNQADSNFQQYQQQLVQDALSKKQQLAANPLSQAANASSADLLRLEQTQALQNQLNSQNSQFVGSGLGLIGQGIGTYYGNKNNQLGTTTLKQPTLASTDASTYNDFARV